VGKTAAGVDDAATAAAAGMDDAATTTAAATITATGTTRRMHASAAGTATDGIANAFITSRSPYLPHLRVTRACSSPTTVANLSSWLGPARSY